MQVVCHSEFSNKQRKYLRDSAQITTWKSNKSPCHGRDGSVVWYTKENLHQGFLL